MYALGLGRGVTCIGAAGNNFLIIADVEFALVFVERFQYQDPLGLVVMKTLYPLQP